MNPMPRFLAGVIAAAAALPVGAEARAATDDTDTEIETLREQIRVLDVRLQQLEQKQRLREQADAAATRAAPRVNVSDRGFSLASADGANVLRVGGLVQLDSRVFFGEGAGNNAFVLRRARLISEGTLGGIGSFQIVPELGGSSVSLLDANVTVAPTGAVQVKFGRFKAPVGLELLQADTATFFVERSLVTNLVPNRDLGVQVGGTVGEGRFTYAVGVFNGVPDAASTSNTDFDNDKDLGGRLFTQPFKNRADSPWRGLGLGVGASLGRQKGPGGVTAGYKTAGQQTFFRYGSAVAADGRTWRVSPQGYYYLGPFGALGEYAVSTVNVRPAATGGKTALQHRAWQVVAGYVLTGEEASFSSLVPRHPFRWDEGTWGAWQLVARYADLELDDRTFPAFASPDTNARGASAVGVGVNWYLNRTVRTSVDYFQTHFDLPATASSPSSLRPDEAVLISRFQLSF
jgi:phosphate-selective porin OprO and OprP